MIESIALFIGYGVIAVILFVLLYFVAVVIKQGYKAAGVVSEMVAFGKKDTVEHDLSWKNVSFFRKAAYVISTWWSFTWDMPHEITQTRKDGATNYITTK